MLQKIPELSIQPCPVHPTWTGCLPYSRMSSEKKNKTNKQNLFKHLLTWQNKHVFCRGRETSERSPYFKCFCFIFLSQRGRAGMSNWADKHIIDKSPSSLECAFCIGKKCMTALFVSTAQKEEYWSKYKQTSWKQVSITASIQHNDKGFIPPLEYCIQLYFRL